MPQASWLGPLSMHLGTHMYRDQFHKCLFSSMARARLYDPIERERGSGKALSGLVSFGWGLSQYVLFVRPSSILLSAPRHT